MDKLVRIANCNCHIVDVHMYRAHFATAFAIAAYIWIESSHHIISSPSAGDSKHKRQKCR